MTHVTGSGMSRRHFLRAGIAAFAVGPLVVACQPQVVEKVVEKPVEKVVEKDRIVVVTPSPQPQVINLKLSTDWNAGPRKEVMDAAKKEYEKNNPNVKIEHWHLGAGGTSGPGGMTDIVVAQLLTSTAADVIGEMSWQPHADHFVEIGTVLKDIGWKEDDYVLTPKTGLDLYFQGKQYGVPYNSVLTSYYYNIDMFEKAGVNPPTEDWTFDDLLAAAQALTKPGEGLYGFHARDYMDWGWGDHIWAEGAGVFSEDGRRLTFCDGSAPDRFQWYVDLIYQYKVSPGPAEATKMLSSGITEPFATGKVAITSGQSGSAGSFVRQIGDRFRYSVMPTAKSPKTGKRAHMFNQGALVVSKVSKDRGNYEEAVKYAAFYNGDFVQKLYAELRPSMPCSRKWLQSPEYTKAPPLNMGQFYKNLTSGDATILINVSSGTKPVGEYSESMMTARRHISTAFTPENAASAKQVFLEACEKGNQILANVK